ncbi:MAG TPA: Gx transporter family protein [Lachnospiraceae bacterium]|nr:Gx transporter family protein [Lachnospiraceae bacterium]
MKSKSVATYGMLIAMAFILSYIESVVTIPVPIPGIKVGLANLVVIIALYLMGPGTALILSFLRIILVGFTFGSLSTMLFSLAGALVSWILMVCAKKAKVFSMTGVSILGGVGHNLGQILVAMYIINSTTLVYYLPFLIVSGLVAGTAIGIVGALLTTRIRRILFFEDIHS